VRVPNPRLVRLGSVTRGAILEQGDGELIVSPVMQPIIELSSPIPRVFPGGVLGGTQEDSFFFGARQSQAGVDAGIPAGSTMAILARGAWVLECYAELSMTVVVNQLVQFFGLALVDPAGNIAPIIGRSWLGPAGGAWIATSGTRVLHISFQVDGFLLSVFTPATAANEGLALMASVNARRIL
jgi:hypothetical protein